MSAAALLIRKISFWGNSKGLSEGLIELGIAAKTSHITGFAYAVIRVVLYAIDEVRQF